MDTGIRVFPGLLSSNDVVRLRRVCTTALGDQCLHECVQDTGVLFVAPWDVPVSMGPTEFRLHSHIDTNVDQVLAPELRAGDAVLMHGGVVHRGGANPSARWRAVAFVTAVSSNYASGIPCHEFNTYTTG